MSKKQNSQFYEPANEPAHVKFQSPYIVRLESYFQPNLLSGWTLPEWLRNPIRWDVSDLPGFDINVAINRGPSYTAFQFGYEDVRFLDALMRVGITKWALLESEPTGLVHFYLDDPKELALITIAMSPVR